MKVLTETERHILTITINRPEVRNCVDGETAALLTEAWKMFRDDDELYVAIITGSGEQAFCAGADLKNVHTLGPGPHATPKQIDDFVSQGPGYIGYTRQTDIFKPIIAAVNGYCLAGGLEIACLADIRIAGETAQFGVACRRYNVPLVDGGTQRLPRIIGMGRALELIVTGRFIDAQEACEIGLVNEVVPSAQVLDRARELARQVSELPQQALRADKEATVSGYGNPLAAGLRIEAEGGQKVVKSKEMAESVQIFVEKRKPQATQWRPQRPQQEPGKDHIGVGCGALIRDDAGQVLLMKRKKSIPDARTTAGMWSVPGGEVDFGEETEHAIIREVKEELGIDVEITKIIGFTDQIIKNTSVHWHCTHFLCHITQGTPTIMEPHKFETVAWFDVQEIPENSGFTHVIRPLYLLGLIDEKEYQRRVQNKSE